MGDHVSSIFYHDHGNFCGGHDDVSFGAGATSVTSTPEDLFSIFDGLEGVCEFPPMTPLILQDGSTANEAGEETKKEGGDIHALVSQKSSSSMTSLVEFETSTSNDVVMNGSCSSSPDQKNKRRKVEVVMPNMADRDGGMKDFINPHPAELHQGSEDPRMQKMSHITVERNRRKQMNEHLSVLRSLMPCFYVKRGDQASIIGGVVEYISELQTLLQSLESKKQRKAYSEVLSPRLVSSPRPSPAVSSISPTKKPPFSPRLPISPRTPTPGSPYNHRPPPSSSRIVSHQQYHHLSPSPPLPTTPIASSSPSPTNTTTTSSSSTNNSNINDAMNELVARLKSPMADVEVKFSGENVEVKTVWWRRIHGQVTKMISAIEHLSLEILNLNVNSVEDTMISSFTIKIGIECQLSAEDLAHQIQQTFC